MKGIVFTQFIEMVESRFSLDMVDDILDAAAPESGGAYTAVGVYDHQELVDLVVALSERTDTPVDVLVRAFGEYLFGVFAQGYPSFFVGVTSGLDFLQGIEDVIHPEVLKLYPDAQLPRFDCQRDGEQLTLVYHSSRHFADLAEGLIQGCAAHFGEVYVVERSELGPNSTRFVIRRTA